MDPGVDRRRSRSAIPTTRSTRSSTQADQLPAKVAALRAHATQVTVAPNGRFCALSNNIALPILTDEHYILVSGTPGERDHRGWETDLLAGLDLG